MIGLGSLPIEYRGLLTTYDGQSEPLSVALVYHDLLKIQKASGPFLEDMGTELRGEILAFGVFGKNEDVRSTWGTLYLQPISEGRLADGSRVSSPDMTTVSPRMLDHWHARAEESTHPILRARYADLIWDFTPTIDPGRKSIDAAGMACDSYIEAGVGAKYKFTFEAVNDVKRALQIAIMIDDVDRIGQAAQAIMDLEDRLAAEEGGWKRSGLAFGALVDNKKVKLPEDTINRLVSAQEAIISDVTAGMGTETTRDPHAAEAAAERLASHYWRHGRVDDARRVVLAYGQIFREWSKQSDGLRAATWLQKVHAIYLQYGLKADAEQIAIELAGAGQRAVGEMKTLAHEFELPRDELDRQLDVVCRTTLADALARVAAEFLPSIDQTTKQVKDLSAQSPLLAVIGHEIMDDEGRVLARLGSIEDDLEGRVVAQMAQNISVMAPFLAYILDGVRHRLRPTAIDVVALLFESPLFEEKRRGILVKGIQAYFEEDHVTAVHLLVPQIEHALRRLVQFAVGSTYKAREKRGGGFFVKNMDELLREPMVRGAMGEDFVRYCQVLFTDQRGINLRNNVMHGIIDPNGVGRAYSDRVLHVLLCLGQARAKEQDDETASGEGESGESAG